jgi:hypothetical protein
MGSDQRYLSSTNFYGNTVCARSPDEINQKKIQSELENQPHRKSETTTKSFLEERKEKGKPNLT